MKKAAAAVALFMIAGCTGEVVDDGQSSLVPAPFFAGDTANGAEFATDVSFWETPLAQSQMDCFWASGVRHVIVGTQQADIAQQQLAMAVSRGMTVDAYVYLYWNQDMASQVTAAFNMTAGFPIGRMWLDIEQAAGSLGSKTINADIQTALTACQSHGLTCGIYTSPGFWSTYTSSTNAFDGVPLWYALYNDKASLSNWSTEAFGGWTKPVGKQFATRPLCDAGGADWDIIQVSASPKVVVDRTVPADSGNLPPAPGNLYPVDGQVLHWDYVKIMSSTVPRATQYQLAVEHWNGSSWVTYYTFSNDHAYMKFYPATANSIYRFRVRAQNAHGWGAWSNWAAFDWGTYTGPRPPTSSPPPPSTTPSSTSSTPSTPVPTVAPTTTTTPPSNPPPAGVPGNLSPPDASTVSSSSVTLSCSAVTSATNYQFAIQTQTSSGYVPYYTYTTTGTSRIFYPQTHGIDYRWQVRAEVGGVWGAWSSFATFHYQ